MKPFYVKAEGVSREKQQELLDLAVDAGGTLFEYRSCTRHNVPNLNLKTISDWDYFGVRDGLFTCFYDNDNLFEFGDNAIEMTYDQAWEYVTGIIRANKAPKPVSREEAIDWLRGNTTVEDWARGNLIIGGWTVERLPYQRFHRLICGDEFIHITNVFPPATPEPRVASPEDIEKAFRNAYSGVNATPITESVGSPTLNRSKPRNKYDHEIIPGVHVDVYDVLSAFPTGGADIDHAIKKLLKPGGRGHKDEITDCEEAIKSIQRRIEHIKEWGGQ